MSKAFENIKVVDFSQVLAGPFATQQLAFLGADVVKVEAPNGEGGRHIRAKADTAPAGMSAVFLSVNAGKRSMTLDLKNPGAKAVVERLLRDADVVIQNFKVGVIQRLGFSYDVVRELNPNIIYCSISGYGQVGPKSAAAAYDPAIQSASGMMQLVGTDASGPLRTGFPLVDMTTGLNAAIAIMGALHRRKETGTGQHLDVAMLDSAMALLAFPFLQYQLTGAEPERLGNGSQLKTPTADVFATAEGHIQVTALTDKQVAALLDTLQLTHLLDDPRFADADARSEHRFQMAALLEQTFALRTAVQWADSLGANGVPSSAVLTLSEALGQEQLQHRNFIKQLTPLGMDAPLSLFSAPYAASEDGPDLTLPPPGVGEHTSAVLMEAGYTESEITQLREAKVI